MEEEKGKLIVEQSMVEKGNENMMRSVENKVVSGSGSVKVKSALKQTTLTGSVAEDSKKTAKKVKFVISLIIEESKRYRGVKKV